MSCPPKANQLYRSCFGNDLAGRTSSKLFLDPALIPKIGCHKRIPAPVAVAVAVWILPKYRLAWVEIGLR